MLHYFNKEWKCQNIEVAAIIMKMKEVKTCDIGLIPDFNLANLENIRLRYNSTKTK